MKWILEPYNLLGIGVLLLLIEAVTGFSTVLLLISGFSVIGTAGLIQLNIVPAEYSAVLITEAILLVVLTALLWKPLQRLQRDRAPDVVSSDLVGETFAVQVSLSANEKASVRYSGLDWEVVSDVDIEADSDVKITGVSVGRLEVTKA